MIDLSSITDTALKGAGYEPRDRIHLGISGVPATTGYSRAGTEHLRVGVVAVGQPARRETGPTSATNVPAAFGRRNRHAHSQAIPGMLVSVAMDETLDYDLDTLIDDLRGSPGVEAIMERYGIKNRFVRQTPSGDSTVVYVELTGVNAATMKQADMEGLVTALLPYVHDTVAAKLAGTERPPIPEGFAPKAVTVQPPVKDSDIIWSPT